jgi:3-deoxy-D-manno-octulosonic-acid transferase
LNLVRASYTTALRLATPALLAHLTRRSRRQTGASDDWRARLGLRAHDMRHPIWIHAASAGEMQAALPLAGALAKTEPLRITTFSASGLARASDALPRIPASLAPLDLPGAWRRFLARTEPRLLILVETELWPNLLAAANQCGLPVVIASARMTSAAAQRLGRFAGTAREMLAVPACVLAQTPGDLERFYTLGLPTDRGRVIGNLKAAQTMPEAAVTRGRTLRAGPLAGRKVWVAGSVREGEETFIAEAAALIRKRIPDAVALIAPRHPERAEGFRAALAARGLEALGAEALDAHESLPPGAIVIVDRLGVLLALYAASDIAFVGGSFANLGGHNLFEPARLGKPILAGANLANVREQAERLEAAGALTVVNKATSLAEKIVALLSDSEAAHRTGAAGRRIASNPAPLARTLDALAPFLTLPIDPARK